MGNEEAVGWLRLAYQWAAKSPDPRTRNGAVLVSPVGAMIGGGCNRIVPVACGTPERYADRDEKLKWVRHAETDAILDAISHGNSPVGSTMVACWAACSHCGSVIVGAGVRRVVRHRHRFMEARADWLDSIKVADEMFAAAGVEVVDVRDVLGVTVLFGGETIEV